MLPRPVKLKELIITKPLLCEILKDLCKKKIKSKNIKMATNAQLSKTESKIETRDFQSRWWYRQTWLASSYNHSKITTKI